MGIILPNFLLVSIFSENYIHFNTYVPVMTVTLGCLSNNQFITQCFAVSHVPWINVDTPWLFQSNLAHFLG